MASQDDDRQSAPTDLFGSLKIVSGAAQSAFSNQSDKVDYGEVAGAASNLLGAASQYGKLDDQQGLGKYVDQAQDYLQKYHQSSTKEPARTESPPSDDVEPKQPDTAPPPADEEPNKETIPAEEVDKEPKKEEEEEEGGGAGDYMKVAQGLLGKSEGGEGAGAGDYVKMAQGFLGKSDKEEGGGDAGVGDYVNIAKGFFGK